MNRTQLNMQLNMVEQELERGNVDRDRLLRLSRELRALHQNTCNNRLYCKCRAKQVLVAVNERIKPQS